MDSIEVSAWLWLVYGCELKLSRVKQLLSPERLQRVGRLADLFDQPVATWQNALGLTPAEVQTLQHHRNRQAEATQLAQQLAAGGVGVWTWNDPGYPAALSAGLDEPHRPLLLFYRGDPAAMTTSPTVAILGTGEPDEETLTLVQDLAGLLAAEGVTLVHGDGPGVEVAARLAVAEEEGRQIVVCGRGLLSDPLPTARPGELLLSPFHPTAQAPAGAAVRYSLVTALAQVILVVGPEMRDQRQDWIRDSLDKGKPVWCCPGQEAGEWVAAGARRLADEEAVLAALEPLWPAARTPVGQTVLEMEELPPEPENAPLPEPDELVKLLAGSGKVPEVLKARLQLGRPR